MPTAPTSSKANEPGHAGSLRRAVSPLLPLVCVCVLTYGMTDVPTPPVAPRKDHREVRHEETVVDPYFWLREKSNPEVVKYLEAENAYTEAMTRDLKPFEDALYREMLGRIKQTDL